MPRPKLGYLILASLVSSIVGFGVPWISVIDERQLSFVASSWITFTALALCFVMIILGIALYQRRGLWVTFAAIPAVVWPAVYFWFVVGCKMYPDNWCI